MDKWVNSLYTLLEKRYKSSTNGRIIIDLMFRRFESLLVDNDHSEPAIIKAVDTYGDAILKEALGRTTELDPGIEQMSGSGLSPNLRPGAIWASANARPFGDRYRFIVDDGFRVEL